MTAGALSRAPVMVRVRSLPAPVPLYCVYSRENGLPAPIPPLCVYSRDNGLCPADEDATGRAAGAVTVYAEQGVTTTVTSLALDSGPDR